MSPETPTQPPVRLTQAVTLILIIIIITKLISYCRPLGLWTVSGPGQDPGQTC